jgi:hypothetical protein
MSALERQRKKIIIDEFAKAKKDAELVWSLVDSELEEPEPLLSSNGNPIIFKNTMVMIQGQTGTHKSRLATSLVSVLVSKIPDLALLGFSRAIDERPTVIYVDTERNINYTLPIAIRQILNDSGLNLEELKTKFSILPLVNIGRQFRTETMGQQFVELTGFDNEKKHFVIVLDIVSDLISDFNNVVNSLQLTDLLNTAANTFDLTFIVVLHENPGGEKARGHLGTELANKASTVLQISLGEINNVFKLKVLKSRSTEKYNEILLKYDTSVNNLTVVDDMLNLAASDPDIIKLCTALGDKNFKVIERQALIDYLVKELRWGQRKIEDKLKKFVNNGIRFETLFGSAILTKKRGKTTEYERVIVNAYIEDLKSLSIAE